MAFGEEGSDPKPDLAGGSVVRRMDKSVGVDAAGCQSHLALAALWHWQVTDPLRTCFFVSKLEVMLKICTFQNCAD